MRTMSLVRLERDFSALVPFSFGTPGDKQRFGAPNLNTGSEKRRHRSILARSDVPGPSASNLLRVADVCGTGKSRDMSGQVQRFEALDGLRGIAAVMVAALHAREVAGLGGPLTGWLTASGAYLCVDFFFVLSGFVLAAAYANRLTTRGDVVAFTLARIGRLWPLHAAALAAVGLILAFGGSATVARAVATAGLDVTFDRASLIGHLLLVQTFGLVPNASWNFAAWSISVELWTNVLFALMLVAYPRARRLWTLALGLGALALMLVFTPGPLSHAAGFPRCIAGFMLGAALALWRRESSAGTVGSAKPNVLSRTLCTHLDVMPAQAGTHDNSEIHPMPAVGPGRRRDDDNLGTFGLIQSGSLQELALLTCVVAMLAFAGDTALSFAAPLLFVAVTAVFAGERGVLSRLLSTAPLRALGQWSYSIYLIHVPLLLAGITFAAAWDLPLHLLFAGLPHVADAGLVVFLVGVIALARLTWGHIEEPARLAANAWIKVSATRSNLRLSWRPAPQGEPRSAA